MIEILRQLEEKLNRINDIEDSLKNLPLILEANKKEVDIIKLGLSGMSEREKEVLTRVCINGEDREVVGKEFGVTGRQIHNWKNNALKTLTRRIYGLNEFEKEGKNNE